MNIFWFAISAFISLNCMGSDVTSTYDKYYSNAGRLSQKDLSYLRGKDIILVPGILSEVFSREDERGNVDFSALSSDYFASQVNHLKHTLKLPTQKLFVSSRSVDETKIRITQALNATRMNNRKAVLITHSLGGLAMLDYLLESDESDLECIEGILFLQTPFFGTPIATVFLDNPYYADKWLAPFLPFFNTSVETIEYLSVGQRMKFMDENKDRIREILARIPVLTMSGVTNRDRTVFKPAVDVMEHGCLLNALRRCLSGKLYPGPYDLSDGMVPLNSSRLNYVDSVVLQGIDHAEPIVKLPFQKVSREIMTESLLKMLLDKSNNRLVGIPLEFEG
ncbi:MAG TPA: hypothetical protein VNJ08_12325 [Bacteriovoracaceae bacterium]|nr:hypothetical protein [Bacteriovoracaceae bacterium]